MMKLRGTFGTLVVAWSLVPGLEAQVFVEDAELRDPEVAEKDNFGVSAAVSLDTVMIGAHANDDAGAAAGAVFVFARSGTTWTMEQELTASDAGPFDQFGFCISMSGDTALIGAPGEDAAGTDSGAAYVLVRSGTAWTEQQKLTASDGGQQDLFGYSASISGETAVVGAHGDATARGSAYVFVRSGTTWSQQQKLTASDAADQDSFGWSVSISGDTVFVGSWQDDDAGTDSGAAYVFVRSGSTWTQQQKLAASDAGAGKRFGTAVSISGETALISAGAVPIGIAGAAYVFVRSGTTWSEQQKLVSSDDSVDEWFGYAVALEGDTAVVCGQLDDHAAPNSGSGYVFVRSGTTWSQRQKLTARDAVWGDLFGRSVALFGDTLVIGANHDGDQAVFGGSAYVFRGVSSPFASFCDASDGALAACPCGNVGDPDSGCDNAQATGGVRLEASSFVPAANEAWLWGEGFPATAAPTAIVIRDDSLEPTPVAFGDGLRCVGSPLVRFGATAASDGISVHHVNHGAGPGVFHYQLWYRNTPASFCNAASAFNTSNGLSITWP